MDHLLADALARSRAGCAGRAGLGDLDLLLRTRSITHLVLTGITTDVCVHTTLRDANDRGCECLFLTDCTGATDHGNYAAALEMVTMQGGVFGAIATSEALLEAIT